MRLHKVETCQRVFIFKVTCSDPKKLDGLIKQFMYKEFGIAPDSFLLISI